MLYFVATPIGNLKDITFRAIEVLSKVDIIFCEDTRHSKLLLDKYEIKKPLESYHKFNEAVAAEKIINLLKDNKEIAVISDAGTPFVSDPGAVLGKRLINEKLDWTVIPGANAFVPALILSGLNSSHFAFIGFLPEKEKEIENLLSLYSSIDASLIFYSAPHDVEKTISSLFKYLGNRKAVAVREITKLYEERIEFNLSDGYKGETRGEFVIVVEGAKQENFENLSIDEHIQLYLNLGLSKMDALKKVARERGISKSELYKYTLNKNNK